MDELAEATFGKAFPVSQLLDLSMRDTLHRLRGVRGLITGWAMLGVPPQEEERLQHRIEEDLILLGRLDWLRAMMFKPPSLEHCCRGEAPSVFLSSALALGTPEEAGARLPNIIENDAALAVALLCLGQKGKAELVPQGVSWLLSFEGKEVEPPSEAWLNAFGHFLEKHQENGTFSFRGNLFQEQKPTQANLEKGVAPDLELEA